MFDFQRNVSTLDRVFTFSQFVNMATSTISTRLEEEELAVLDSLAEYAGFDRSQILKSIFRRGISQWRFELAIQQYRDQQITLSKAAELAGLSQWDFIAQMKIHGATLHFDAQDLELDLAHVSRL